MSQKVLVTIPRFCLVGEGVLRSIGVSRYEIYHLEEIKTFGGVTPAVNQLEFHAHSRRPALRKYCEENGIFIQVYRLR